MFEFADVLIQKQYCVDTRNQPEVRQQVSAPAYAQGCAIAVASFGKRTKTMAVKPITTASNRYASLAPRI